MFQISSRSCQQRIETGGRCGRRGLFGTNWVSILASLPFLTGPPRLSSCCCLSKQRRFFGYTVAAHSLKAELCYANKKYWIIENGIKNLEQKPLDKANGKKFGFHGRSTVHYNNRERKEERKASKRLVTAFHSLGNRVVCKRVLQLSFHSKFKDLKCREMQFNSTMEISKHCVM